MLASLKLVYMVYLCFADFDIIMAEEAQLINQTKCLHPLSQFKLRADKSS